MRQPKRNDVVYMQSRMDSKEYPDGRIIQTMRNYEDPELSEVMIHFKSPPPTYERAILTYNGEIHYEVVGDIVRLLEGTERIEDLKPELFIYIFVGAEYAFEPCDEIITLSYMDLEGNYSSSAGGSGRWEL
jgi:hypothetical protein